MTIPRLQVHPPLEWISRHRRACMPFGWLDIFTLEGNVTACSQASHKWTNFLSICWEQQTRAGKPVIILFKKMVLFLGIFLHIIAILVTLTPDSLISPFYPWHFTSLFRSLSHIHFVLSCYPLILTRALSLCVTIRFEASFWVCRAHLWVDMYLSHFSAGVIEHHDLDKEGRMDLNFLLQKVSVLNGRGSWQQARGIAGGPGR